MANRTYPPSLALACAAALVALVALCPVPSARAAPIASFSFTPAEPLTNEPVTFTSAYEDPQSWDLDGDGACDDGTGSTIERTFDTAGTYSVTLCVTDGADTATSTRAVTVHNRPPVAGFNYAPVSPLTGDAILLTSTSSDADGPIMSLQWDLDNDGAFDDASGSSATVTFMTPGVHTVRLMVGDREGADATAGLAISVSKRPPKLFAFLPVVRMTAVVRPSGTRVRSLTVTAPTGSSVTIRCHRRGCAFRKLTRRARANASRRDARAARLIRVVRLRRRVLKPGALVTVRITAPDTIGKYTSFRVRKGKPPRRRDRCLIPGNVRPVRCPSA